MQKNNAIIVAITIPLVVLILMLGLVKVAKEKKIAAQNELEDKLAKINSIAIQTRSDKDASIAQIQRDVAQAQAEVRSLQNVGKDEIVNEVLNSMYQPTADCIFINESDSQFRMDCITK